MEEKISLKEFQRRWTVLLQHQDDFLTTTPNPNCPQQGDNKNDNDYDLHDCSFLFIPPRIQQLDGLVDGYVDQWKQLDERKISADSHNNNNNNSDENKIKPAWYEKHIRLPRDFDFASKNSAPPVDDGTGDRILSLQDPTQTLSYHAALWELFHSIPLASQIEKETVSEHQLTHMQALYDKMLPVSGQTRLDEEGIQALTRIRMGDRHGLLPQQSLPQRQRRSQQTVSSRKRQRSHHHSQQQFVATLQLECWRNLPRHRGSPPDPDRMVLEFLGSQTLLDVHHIIVELAQDDLWWRREDRREDDGASNTEDDDGGGGDKEVNQMDTDKLQASPDSSGLFFIEGVFYTTGSTDYVTNIHDWLQKGRSHKEKTARWGHLGLTYDKENVVLPPVQDMASTRLEDLELRLAVRYMHTHHGNVECSIYVTDRKVAPVFVAGTKYPLIHDIWTPAGHPGECDACKVRMGTIVTSNTCPITMGHRLLCQSCAEQLQLYQKCPTHVEEFSIWKR